MKTAVHEPDISFLSRLQLFRNVDLENPALFSLLSLCKYRSFNCGETVLSTKQKNHYLYVVIKGGLLIQLSEHDDIPMATVEPGECVGGMSVIDSGGFPLAQVSALEKTTVLAIEQDILWRMVSVSHEIARNLLYIMSERIRFSNLVVEDSLEMQHKYQQYAMTDALTGLHNRGWLDDAFDREIKRSERDQLPLSLIMLDVDNFKQYNDDYGHQAGDKVLVTVAKSIHKTLRPNDLVARYGGEEFAVLLPETPLEKARAIAERLRKHVSNANPGRLNKKQLPKITISSGITGREPGCTLDSMIAAADIAMYQAKRKGRNRVEVAPDAKPDS